MEEDSKGNSNDFDHNSIDTDPDTTEGSLPTTNEKDLPKEIMTKSDQDPVFSAGNFKLFSINISIEEKKYQFVKTVSFE